jgi:hypothetical protein
MRWVQLAMMNLAIDRWAQFGGFAVLLSFCMPAYAGWTIEVWVAAGLFDEKIMSSSRHGSSLKLDAEDLEVAGLGGYALGAAGDDESGDRQVGMVWWLFVLCVSACRRICSLSFWVALSTLLQIMSSSRHGSSLKLDAEDLEVAGLGGYALGAAGDDESGDRQVGGWCCCHLVCPPGMFDY